MDLWYHLRDQFCIIVLHKKKKSFITEDKRHLAVSCQNLSDFKQNIAASLFISKINKFILLYHNILIGDNILMVSNVFMLDYLCRLEV